MKEVIIPEVIKQKLPDQNRNQKIIINLNKTIDKRDYSVNHESYIQNNNTNMSNINKGGLISFIIQFLTFPFKLIYNIFNFFNIKYDIKNKLNMEKIAVKKDKLLQKMLRKHRDIWNNDEIF